MWESKEMEQIEKETAAHAISAWLLHNRTPFVLRAKVTADDFNSNSTPDLTIQPGAIIQRCGQAGSAGWQDVFKHVWFHLVHVVWSGTRATEADIWERHLQQIIRV